MNLRKHPRLILVLTALFILVCRCTMTTAAPAQTTSDGVALSQCNQYFGFGEPNGIVCEIPCNDPEIGAGTAIPLFASPGSATQFSDLTYAELQEQACNAFDPNGGGLFSFLRYDDLQAPAGNTSSSTTSNNAAPTEAPTEEPTEAPTADPADQPLASILGGRVSYCSVTGGQYYMNLPFNSGANPETVQQELDNGDLKVVISGTTTEGRCKVLAANNMLLCAFPASSFPAFGAANTILNVVSKGTIIDVLPFNNACTVPQQLNSGGEGGDGSDGGGGSVPACDPHTDSSCPVDCSNPSNADLCG